MLSFCNSEKSDLPLSEVIDETWSSKSVEDFNSKHARGIVLCDRIKDRKIMRGV